MSTSNTAGAESFVPIKEIVNNTIVLDNGYKVAGVKVYPKNIFIMDEQEQFGTISGLKDLYNIIDFPFWLVIADRPVDISVYIAEMQMQYNSANSPIVKKLISQDLNKADDFRNNVSDVEFYLLFRSNNDDFINKNVRTLMQSLANAGLSSAQANDDDLRSILDNFLNGGMKTEFGTVMS